MAKDEVNRMDDLISRQSAIDAIDEYMVGKNCAADGTMMARLINELVIKQLPSALPPSAEPKRARWEMPTLGDMFMMDAPKIIYCSACNVCSTHATPYCPICGAKMEDKNE